MSYTISNVAVTGSKGSRVRAELRFDRGSAYQVQILSRVPALEMQQQAEAVLAEVADAREAWKPAKSGEPDWWSCALVRPGGRNMRADIRPAGSGWDSWQARKRKAAAPPKPEGEPAPAAQPAAKPKDSKENDGGGWGLFPWI